ncbi:MAG TPA: sulfatase-like hydrolase/transferase, partial [Pirellulales bacterium]
HRTAGQPFFAVFNCEKSHESKLRIRPHVQIHDPAKVRVPAYHPDTPEVRLDWAQYYDTVTEADAAAGARLKELEQAGLAADTIVFYFADHGSGMPGNKRWPREAGLHVPLVVYIPDRFADLRTPDARPGGRADRLVSFVDFAPTVLSLAGIEPPDWMQGFAFLGKHATPPQPFVYGFRGRMDERNDLIRCVTDGRFVYIRNFRPDKIYGQHLEYMWQTPTTRVWEQLFQQGKLNAAQSAFWKTKPPEELYELASDPDEVHNLAASSEHAETRDRLRAALHEQMASIRDVGLLSEGEMHRRSADWAPYDMGHDPAQYPFAAVYGMADLASSLRPDAMPLLARGLTHTDSAVRCWAVLGLLMRGAPAVAANRGQLLAAFDDSSPDVRVAAAEALGRYGNEADLSRALTLLGNLADWSRHDLFTAMAALNAITSLGDNAAPLAATLAALPTQGPAPSPRYSGYVPRLLTSLRASLPASKASSN